MTAPAQMGSTRPALSTFPNFGIGLCSGRGLSFVCHRWDIGDAADSRKRGKAATEGKQMTPTEKRIKRLWLAGRTSQEIAAEIGMNERMVQGILNDLGL